MARTTNSIDDYLFIQRLDNLQSSIETVLQEDIKGDFIEKGVWRCNACIFMCAVLAAYKVENRKVILADSFMGLPKINVIKNSKNKGDQHFIYNYLAVSKAEVEENFRNYGLLDEKIIFLEGWFHDTLPNAPIEKLAILRFDGDMYASTIVALENLYRKLSKGGFCIIDDYVLHGCKSAVQDYRIAYNITAELVSIDRSFNCWRKS